MKGEENLGNLRVYIHELGRQIVCPCKAFVVCEEHRTLNAKHGTVAVYGKRVTAGPIGCKLHKDKEHQDIAATCGYCDDFHCFQSLVRVDREITKE